MIVEIIVASLLIMFASLVGVLVIWKGVGKFLQNNLNYLVSFAAGVFLILVYLLSREVITEATSATVGFFWIIAGLFLVYILIKIIPESHHHHHEGEHKQHNKLDARKLLIGDSFHNIGDGVLLAVAFISSSTIGITAAVSIFFHELVQEISEFFVLRQAGYDTKGALKINFITSSTLLLGSVGGFFLLDQFALLEIPVLGLATGALLALLLEDLLPHSLAHAKEKKCVNKHIFAAVIGALVMFTVFSFTNDSHSHDDELLLIETQTILL